MERREAGSAGEDGNDARGVRSAVRDGVRPAVLDGVRSAVRDGVRSAVPDGVRPALLDGDRTALLEWVLRIGAAGCFVGHGAFGILGKEAWLPYFAVAGIGEDLAWTLMPLVGGLDILVGILVLVSPRPVLLGYMAVWALWTALLRPLAGESVFEVLERAGNYGVPLAFLVAAGASFHWRRGRSWLSRARVRPLSEARRRHVAWILRATVALLMVGHGALALEGKPLLAGHLAAVGLSPGLLPALGWTEIALGVAVALRPARPLLATVLLWKLGTEALFPLAGAPFWEFVERAGSYAAPLLLLMLGGEGVRRTAPGARPAEPAPDPGASPVHQPIHAFTEPTMKHAFPLTASAAALLVAAPLILFGESGKAGMANLRTPTLLESLRQGGYVLACRHAVTDRSRGDQRPVSLRDRSTQRLLSEEGEAQARALGRELRSLGIPVGQVVTGRYFRNADTGELAFGLVETHAALDYGRSREKRDARRRLLADPPINRSNRALVTHQGILYEMLPDVERGSIGEGHCVVVEPRGDGGYEALERVEPGRWSELS